MTAATRSGGAADVTGEDESYFVSMTDMLVGMLFVFIIILMAFALNLKNQETELAKTTDRLTEAQATRAQMRERISEFLLRHLKDPRIHPINWQGVGEEALRVIRKWLTRVALEQFLQVVDKVAEAGHWQYRRAFWMAYYEAGLIDEAWVVFAPGAERIGSWGLRQLAGYGRLANPRLNNRCALLMRLPGDLINSGGNEP